jgi:hypothetical protein
MLPPVDRRVEPKAGSQDAGDARAKDAYHDVADQAEAITFHEKASQPAMAPMTIHASTDSGPSM